MHEQQVDSGGGVGESSSATELLDVLQTIARAHDGLHWEFARRSEMRLVEHIALDYVMTARQLVGPGELSARVGMSTGSGTELVDRLVRSGQLERRPHPRDGRRIVLEPTSAARERVRRDRAPVAAAIGELAEGLTVGEVETITTYLGRAIEVITAHRPVTGTSVPDAVAGLADAVGGLSGGVATSPR